MNTKRITLYLYQDEYDFIQKKSEEERVSMNKVFQFWIRDEMDKAPVKLTVPERIKKNPTFKKEVIEKVAKVQKEYNIDVCKHGYMKGVCKFGCK